jgi:hypothetical protein
MKNIILTTLLILTSIISYSQTENQKLNTQLEEMKGYFLVEDYENFSKFTYPKIIEMMGGKEKFIEVTKQGMNKIKNDGFTLIDISYKNGSALLEKDGELQCSLTQIITLKTPRGKIESEYTLIAISVDKGINWTFMDTSGKTLETMLKYFPNLNENLIIKPKSQKWVD